MPYHEARGRSREACSLTPRTGDWRRAIQVGENGDCFDDLGIAGSGFSAAGNHPARWLVSPAYGPLDSGAPRRRSDQEERRSGWLSRCAVARAPANHSSQPWRFAADHACCRALVTYLRDADTGRPGRPAFRYDLCLAGAPAQVACAWHHVPVQWDSSGGTRCLRADGGLATVYPHPVCSVGTC